MKYHFLAIFLMLLTSAAFTQDEASDWREGVWRMDLETAELSELKEWASRLELDQEGTVEQLRARIAEKLGISKEEADAPERTVSIEAAESLNTFQMESVGEDYIRITGGVRIVLNDRIQETTHRITADTLILNQTRSILEAKGSVTYTLNQGSTSEVFRGESLVFRLDNWMGVFYGGSSERDRTVGGKTLKFLFAGEEITRSGDDVVIMDEGLITSSVPEDPYYSIRASRIWILAPGEWGFENAFLHIGRVPVFWFPLYFQPGDEMWFNPVIGIPDATDRRGIYLQTTTYLFGKKKQEDSPLSFLQLGESDDSSPRVWSGLYLVRDTESAASAPVLNGTLKVLADLYSNLGFYTGLDGSLSQVGPLESWTLLAGLAFSRNVYPGAPWKPYLFNPDEEVWEQSVWNRSLIFGLEVPFRYRLESRAQMLGWSLVWEYWSDPFLGEDFGSRSETFSPFALIGFGPKPSSVTESKKSSLIWSLSGSANPPISFMNPWVKSLSVTPIEGRLDFGLRTHPDFASPDPSREWYAPTRFTLPNFRVNMSGDILSLGRSTPSSKPPLLDPFRAPEEETTSGPQETEASAEKVSEGPVLLIPGTLTAPAASSFPSTSDSSLLLNYSWNGSWTTDGDFNQVLWTRPQDADWSVRYARHQYNHSGKLGLSTQWSGSFLKSDHSLSFSDRSRWSWYLDEELAPADITAILSGDAQNISTQVTTAHFLSVSPLQDFFPLRQTLLSYQLGFRVYEKRYQSFDSGTNTGIFQELFPEWNKEAVTQHEINATLPWTPFSDAQLLNINLQGKTTFDPRPVERTLTLNMSSKWETLSTTLSAGIRGNETEWLPDLLRWTFEWAPYAWRFSNTLDYDLRKERWNSETATLTGYGLSLRYYHTQTVPYYFDEVGKRWTAGFREGGYISGDTFFLPLEASASYQLPAWSLKDASGWWETNLSASANASINLQQYTNATLTLQTSLAFKVANYLDVSFSASSTNRAFYRYIPGLAESLGLGLETVNPIEDILKGFAFWNNDLRRESFFKISRLSLSATHLMPDWTLTFKLEGTPKLEGLPQQYVWATNFSILLAWKPITEIKNDLKVDDKGVLTVETDS